MNRKSFSNNSVFVYWCLLSDLRVLDHQKDNKSLTLVMEINKTQL